MMRYLDNITLTILIILLRDGVLTISVPDAKSCDELTTYVSTLDSLFKDKPKKMTIEEEEEYKETYVPTLQYQSNGRELTVQCKNSERLETFLKEYAQNYNDGILVEEGNSNEFDRISALQGMLITKAKDSTKDTSHYIVTNSKYAPLILFNSFEYNEFIQGLTIQLAPIEEMPYPMILFERNLDGTPDQYVSDWQKYFHCRYVLNMDWYIEEHIRLSSKTVSRERRKDFAPLTKRVYRYLFNNAKEGVFHLSRTDLKNCMTLTNKDKTLTDLRDQYREIFGKSSDFDIISYNRGTKMYDIHEDILTDK